MKLRLVGILFLILNWSIWAQEQCSDYPLVEAVSYSYPSLFSNAKDMQEFIPELMEMANGQKGDALFQVSPSAFIDYSTGKLHQIPGATIVNGTQTGEEVFLINQKGALRKYNIKSGKLITYPHLSDKTYTSCDRRADLAGYKSNSFGTLCVSRDGTGVFLVGGNPSRVIPLNKEQTKIVDNSSDGRRQINADGNIAITSLFSGETLVISGSTVEKIQSKTKEEQIVYVDPSNPDTRIVLKQNGEFIEFYIEKKGNSTLVDKQKINSSNFLFKFKSKFSISENESGDVGIHWSNGNQKTLTSINIQKLTSKSINLSEIYSDKYTSVSGRQERGPYWYGIGKSGKMIRIDSATGAELKPENMEGKYEPTHVRKVVRQDKSDLYLVNDDLMVEVVDGRLNLYPKGENNYQCVPDKKLQVEIDKSCNKVKSFCGETSEDISNPEHNINESTLIKFMLAISNPEKLQLSRDFEIIMRGLSDEFIAKYPDISSAVLESIFIKNPSLYDKMIRENPGLGKLQNKVEGLCSESYIACLYDNNQNSKGAEVAMRYAAKSGSTIGLKLFSPSVSKIPQETRELFFKKISTNSTFILQLHGEANEKFEKFSMAQQEASDLLQLNKDPKNSLKVRWVCPVSITPAPTKKTEVEISYIKSINEFNLGDIADLITDLKKNPNYDYTSCLASLHKRIIIELLRDKNFDEKMIVQLDDRLMGMTFSYADAAKKAEALSPLVGNSDIYPPLTKEYSDYMLSEVMNCRIPTLGYAIGKEFLQRLKDNMKIISTLDEEKCLKPLAQNYVQAISSTLMSESECNTKPDECTYRTKKAVEAIQELALAGIIMDDDLLVRYSGICHNGRMPTDFLVDVFDMLNPIAEEAAQCAPLAEGESKDIHVYRVVQGHYKLRRLKDVGGRKNFEITVQIRFVDPKHSKISKYADDVFSTVQGCFAKHKTQFRDEYGNSISFKLLHNKSNKADLMIHDVFLHEKYPRANSKNYPIDIGCGTAIHETMHLLGIPDEYHEASIGLTISEDGTIKEVKENADISSFDCRIKAPDDSLMNNHKKALRKSSRSTLLYPAHFRLLTNPHCNKDNAKYLKCTSIAYTNSSENLKANYRSFYGRKMCPVGIPDYCRDAGIDKNFKKTVGDWLK